MSRAIPYLAALQWLVGIVLAYLAVGRARDFRRRGAWPLGFGRVALGAFVLGALLLASTSAPVAPFVSRAIPLFESADGWRMSAFLQVSQLGWGLVVVAMVWNGVLGTIDRKRAAREELARRRARVRGEPGDPAR